MDILLTHAYYLFEDPAERRVMKPYPPLGLLYITSHLRSLGFDVGILDSTFMSRADHLREMRAARAPVVGIYVNLMTRANALQLIRVAKEAGATVVLGGPEPVNYAEEYLARGADVVVAGEGELTLTELLPVLRDHGAAALDTVAGIIYRDPCGAIRVTRPREQIKRLDGRPYPARESIDMHRYLDTWRTHHGASSVSLITARGCPYTCRWCSHSVYGFSYRHRSPEDVADELEHIREAYAPDRVWYADDVFSMSRPWLQRFAAELQRRDIRMPFETISREDRLDEETIGLLADLGCYRLWVGAESGSQRVLDAMDRRTDAARMREVIQLLKRHGIRAGTFIMLGYEGERWNDIDSTAEHLRESLPDDLLTTIAYPIKGTPYYEEVRDRIVTTGDWETGSDRQLSVAGRHSRRFYHHAQKWISHEVALSRERSNGDGGYVSLMRNFVQAKKHRAAMHLFRHEKEPDRAPSWVR
jgi:radical SAM superfamily enzyme YgiQ (UPF0313 family)